MRDDILRGNLPFANRHEHGFGIGEIQLISNTDQCLGSQQSRNRKIALAHGSCQLIATFFNGFGSAFLAEPLANLVTGFRAFRKAQPVTRWTSRFRLRCKHFNGIAVYKLGVERYQTAVHAGAMVRWPTSVCTA